jgi:hypothetical protein
MKIKNKNLLMKKLIKLWVLINIYIYIYIMESKIQSKIVGQRKSRCLNNNNNDDDEDEESWTEDMLKSQPPPKRYSSPSSEISFITNL